MRYADWAQDLTARIGCEVSLDGLALLSALVLVQKSVASIHPVAVATRAFSNELRQEFVSD